MRHQRKFSKRLELQHTMALSKPSFVKFDEKVSEKINKIFTEEYNGTLSSEEIITFCKITKEKPISIECIRHMLGGEDMEHPAIELTDSLECYQFCRADMIKHLKETKLDIAFYEDRVTSDANITLAVIKKPKKCGKGQQISLIAVIRFTLFTTPRVGFCRYFELTGKHVS